MQEVQALCDRVMIINQGSIVANDTIETLQNRISGENVVTVEFLQAVDKALLSKIKNITKVTPLPNATGQVSKTAFSLSSALKNDIRADVFNFAVEQKLVILEMRKEVYSVADVFQELTKSSSNWL